jgi:hypothetical protein
MAAAVAVGLAPPLAPLGHPGPPNVSDYEDHLPVRFKLAAGLRWVIRLREFITFEPEAVAGGGSPTYFEASLWDLEAMLFRVVDCGGLADACMPGDTCFKIRLIARIFRVLHWGGLSANSFASEEEFVRAAQACIEGMADADRAHFTVTAADLQALPDSAVPLNAQAGWAGLMQWNRMGKHLGRDIRERSSKLLRVLGSRTRDTRANPDHRFSLLASQIGAAFDTQTSNTVAAALRGVQVVWWWAKLKFPIELSSQVAALDVHEATAELTRILNYETAAASWRAGLVGEVFDRVLEVCPRLKLIAGQAKAEEARDAINLLLSPFELTPTPSLSDYRLLDKLLERDGLIDLATRLGDGANELHPRVQAIASDLKDTARVYSSHKDPTAAPGSTSVGAASSGFGGPTPESVNELRRLPRAEKVIKRLKKRVKKKDELGIMGAMMTSRLTAVCRFATGELCRLAVDAVFQAVLPYRCNSFVNSAVLPLCRYFWYEVTKPLHDEFPMLKTGQFAPSFVRSMIAGNMATEDLEQRLVLDIQVACFGVKPNYLEPTIRDSSVWYTDRYLLEELVGPLSRFEHARGYGNAVFGAEDSPAALVSSVVDGFRFEKANKEVAGDVLENCPIVFRAGLSEADERWHRFYVSASAIAPFPDTWLDPETQCTEPLDEAIEGAKSVATLARRNKRIAMRLGLIDDEATIAKRARGDGSVATEGEEELEGGKQKKRKTGVIFI